ncbi:hypothetical protein HPP92_014506 [Vanilla planifolia]|uniref:Uncharacterized protein n=1 Tax=Vanilla planifolia TaxID=51239 RepID=A0A835UWA5_VANPL|nr:hypothetical protein HPP92_014506 [Vanilla planifolia]
MSSILIYENHCHLIGYQPPPSSELGHRLKQSHQGQASQHKASAHGAYSPREVQVETSPVEQIIGLPTLNVPPASHAVEVHASALLKDTSDSNSEESQDCEEMRCSNLNDSTSDEKMSEENLHLFNRCEQFQLRQAELKQTIDELERELERAKRRCSVSLHRGRQPAATATLRQHPLISSGAKDSYPLRILKRTLRCKMLLFMISASNKNFILLLWPAADRRMLFYDSTNGNRVA